MRTTVAALVALALAARSPLALARSDAEVQAQALFVDGMKLMGQTRYAEACPKLAQSQALDPGMGTQFRLAECYEKLGRLASAYEQFNAVAEAARAARKPDRETVARERVAALAGRVSKLVVVVPPALAALAGVTISRDGTPLDRPLWGTPVPVDTGEHTVRVEALGKRAWEGKATAVAGAPLSVSVPPLDDDGPVAPPPPPPSRSLVPTIALGVVGGVGLVLGGVFVGLRAIKASDAQGLHDTISAAHGDCLGGASSPFAAECSALSGDTHSGDTFGTVAVVGFAVGGAALVGMATTLLVPALKPPASGLVRLGPVAFTGGGGVVGSGAF